MAASPGSVLETLLYSKFSGVFNSFRRPQNIESSIRNPPATPVFSAMSKSPQRKVAVPCNQGLDLLETRGWADRASGVIEA
jgi:hypothetical protein